MIFVYIVMDIAQQTALNNIEIAHRPQISLFGKVIIKVTFQYSLK